MNAQAPASQPTIGGFECGSEQEALCAGLLSGLVMAGYLTLSSEPACRRAMDHAVVHMEAVPDQMFRAAHTVAIRMIEDRARRATAFREPRR